MQEDKLLQIVRKQEDLIRFQRLESAFFWNAEGHVLLSRTGKAHQVVFTRQELKAINAVIATHNHPSGMNYAPHDPRYASNAFSLSDIKLACLTELQEVRVVTPKHRYSLKPASSGWDLAYFEGILRPEFEQTFLAVRRQLIEKVQARKILSAEAGMRLLHEVWTRVAQTLGLEYACYED